MRELGRAGMLSDGGAPRCPSCRQPLHFGTDRDGRATETCACGYRGYVGTRGGELHTPPVPPHRHNSPPTSS
jgi:hypothetical protein